MGFNWAFKGLKCPLTLILLTWRIWRAPNNTSRWQMGFNSAIKLFNIFVSIPLVARSKAWLCGRPAAVIAGSSPSQGVDIRLFCLFVLLR